VKLVILGKGGQGVIFFSRVIARAALGEGFSVCGTEIKGMAKKGGPVEIHLKIGEGRSPLIKPGEADLVIVLSEDLKEYGSCFGKKLFVFSKEDIKEALSKVPPRQINTYLLGRLIKKEPFLRKEAILKVLDSENQKFFLEGWNDV